MEICKEYLHSNSPKSNSVPALWTILREIIKKYDISLEDIRCWRRHGIISAARFEFYYRACSETTATTSVIAKALDADRTSVLYGLTRYCSYYKVPHPRGRQVSNKALGATKFHGESGMKSLLKRRAAAAAKSYPAVTKTQRHQAALRGMRHDKLAQALIREGYKPTI
jgi:hypothetical protein